MNPAPGTAIVVALLQAGMWRAEFRSGNIVNTMWLLKFNACCAVLALALLVFFFVWKVESKPEEELRQIASDAAWWTVVSLLLLPAMFPFLLFVWLIFNTVALICVVRLAVYLRQRQRL